jgi:peptide/nickel transport system permease protein
VRRAATQQKFSLRVAALLALVAGMLVLGLFRNPGLLWPERAWEGPSLAHPLGCAEAGIDVLGVVSYGALYALTLAVCVATVACLIGLPLGAFCAFKGKERALYRLCDLLQAFPTFLLAMVALASAARPTRVHLLFVFSLTAWAPFARLAAVEAQVLRSAGYVEAARALGLGTVRTVWRHIAPALAPIARVQLGASAAATVVGEAALAFVGFGPRDGVSLGTLLEQGVVSMLRAPHVLVAGSVSVFITSRLILFAFAHTGGGSALFRSKL